MKWVLDLKPSLLSGMAVLPSNLFIGEILKAPAPAVDGELEVDNAPPPAQPPRAVQLRRRPEIREAAEDEDDDSVGPWMIQSSDPIEQVQDPMGMQRPTDRDSDISPDEVGDSLSELREARLKRSPHTPHEVFLSEDLDLPRQIVDVPRSQEAHWRYPEWDYRKNAYRDGYVTVMERLPTEVDETWLAATEHRQRALIEKVKRQFAHLKPRREPRKRLTDGDALDIDACVELFSSRRGDIDDEPRIYTESRPARHDTAIAVLLDASASTDAWLAGTARVIDVEKETLLVLCHALNELGGPFALYAFSGNGPSCVDLFPLKVFEAPVAQQTWRAISAVEPQRYTRLGGAIRHACAALARQAARNRLLLILTDGKPNDMDEYEGRYGNEDCRMAVREATNQNIVPFCLTIDRAAPRYVPSIFGPGHYAILQRTEHLPRAVVDLIRRLLSS